MDTLKGQQVGGQKFQVNDTKKRKVEVEQTGDANNTSDGIKSETENVQSTKLEVDPAIYTSPFADSTLESHSLNLSRERLLLNKQQKEVDSEINSSASRPLPSIPGASSNSPTSSSSCSSDSSPNSSSPPGPTSPFSPIRSSTAKQGNSPDSALHTSSSKKSVNGNVGSDNLNRSTTNNRHLSDKSPEGVRSTSKISPSSSPRETIISSYRGTGNFSPNDGTHSPAQEGLTSLSRENSSSSSKSNTNSPPKANSPSEGGNPNRVSPTKPSTVSNSSISHTSSTSSKSGSSSLPVSSSTLPKLINNFSREGSHSPKGNTNSSNATVSRAVTESLKRNLTDHKAVLSNAPLETVGFARPEIHTDGVTKTLLKTQDIAFESYVQYHRESDKLTKPEFLNNATLAVVEQQIRLSNQLLKRAAEQGNSEAACTVAHKAMIKLIGSPEANTNQNRENALKYAQRAVALDPKNAQPILDLVVRKITQTAGANNGHAWWQLGVLNFHKKTPEARERGLEYATLAMKHGYQRAGSELAEMYLTGNGIEKNSDKAIKLLDEAVKQNESYGLYVYGKAIIEGTIKGASKQGVEYIKASANGEDVSGLVYLGGLYLSGEHVLPDLSKAESNFQSAYMQVIGDEDQAEKIALEVFEIYKNKMLDKDNIPEDNHLLHAKIEEWAARAKQHGNQEVAMHMDILKNWKALDVELPPHQAKKKN